MGGEFGGEADIRIYCMREEKRKRQRMLMGTKIRVFKRKLNTLFCREINQAQKARNSVVS